MRINMEPYKQPFQAVADLRIEDKQSGGEICFQEMILQMLSMMIIPNSGQPDPGQGFLSEMTAIPDQDHISAPNSILQPILATTTLDFSLAHLDMENLPQPAMELNLQKVQKEENQRQPHETNISDNVVSQVTESVEAIYPDRQGSLNPSTIQWQRSEGEPFSAMIDKGTNVGDTERFQMDKAETVKIQEMQRVHPGGSISIQEDDVRRTGETESEQTDMTALHSPPTLLKSIWNHDDVPSHQPVQIQNLEDIVARMREKITMIREGEHAGLKMKLKPEQLGEIEIRLCMKDGFLFGEIQVETLSAGNALENQLQSLKDRLRDQNISLHEMNIVIHQNNREPNRERSRGFFQERNREQNLSIQVTNQDYGNPLMIPQMARFSHPMGATGNSLDRLA